MRFYNLLRVHEFYGWCLQEHGGKLYTSEGNRVSMIEKSSGRLIAGMTAPVVTNLTEWILKNPSFQVLVSGKF